MHSINTVSRRESLLLAAVAAAIVPAVLWFAGGLPSAAIHFGDNDAFVTVADALRARDFTDVPAQQFWGMSYVVAALSALAGISTMHALWLCSWICAAGTIWLAADVFGPAVAVWFGIASFPWLQRASLGGNEPLFLLLLLAMFHAARRRRWWLAALLAALSTTVRPIGAVAVFSVVVALVAQRAVRAAGVAVVIAAGVATAYALPLWRIYGDPLANVAWYRDAAWQGQGLPIAFPLAPLLRGWILDPPTPLNALKTLMWLGITMGGFAALIRRGSAREMWAARPVEAAFAVGGLLFVCCYNAPFWAPKEFARFILPVAPFALLGLEPWLPTSRRILWPVAVAAGVLAASSLLR